MDNNPIRMMETAPGGAYALVQARLRRMRVIAVAAALLAGAGRAALTTVAELDLVDDVTINVAAGATTDVERVIGGAYTITKTGAGVVRFGFLQNSSARLVVRGGREEFYVPDASNLLAEAALHMDANNMHNGEYTETLNGTNFVTRWYQSSHPGRALYAVHDDYAPSYRADPANRRPFVRKSYQNGLDVVDFGALQTTNNVDASGVGLGYGAAMVLTAETNCLRDVYLIGGFTEDVKSFRTDWPTSKNGMSSAGIIGSGGGGAFMPGLFSDASDGGYPPLVNFWQGNTYAYQSVNGQIYVNDDMTTGLQKTILPDGISFINFRLVEPSQSDPVERTALFRFARYGNRTFGGARIGEVAAFTRSLTAAERSKVENHLRSKWFAQRFARVDILPDGPVQKTTDGTAYCPGFTNTPDIAVSAGTVVVDPLARSGAWIHLDASQIDADGLAVVNGKRVLDTWPDADGGLHYATHNAIAPSWRSDPANRKPFLSSGWASNNLHVVDFGYPQNPGIVDGNGQGVGYGAAMVFDTACTTIREALMVVGDYEEAKTVLANYPNAAHSTSMFLGGTRLSRRFGRHIFENNVMPLVINPWQAFAKSVTTNASGIAVNGEQMAVGTGVRLDPGMHLLNFRALEDMQADGIGMDFGNVNYANFGGVRIGEMLVFESELDDVLRSRMTATLMAKWKGAEPLVYAAGRVSVEGGATLDIPYASLSANELVLGSGIVKAVSVRPRTMVLRDLFGAIEGNLDMGEAGGSVTFDDSSFSLGDPEPVRLVTASSLSGEARRWRGFGATGRRYRCSVGADGLYCSAVGGLVLQVR